MPCKDVTEYIRVVLDASDTLKEYRFIKRTCGQGVGADALLLDQLKGRSLTWFLEADADAFLQEFPAGDELEEFLTLKHFFAIQGALEVLSGKAAGGPGAVCAAAEIACDDSDLVIDARINVDLLTDRIRSCGNCKGCGKSGKTVVFH